MNLICGVQMSSLPQDQDILPKVDKIQLASNQPPPQPKVESWKISTYPQIPLLRADRIHTSHQTLDNPLLH